MTEVQKRLFDLVIELDEICKKHDIVYYLIGGSTLGAIRHQGFLPWDDDIDIVMTKNNWEKLKKAFETDLPPNRVCASWEDCDEEPSVFFRYVDTTQTFILHSLWEHKMPWGGIIDIFVLNPLPTDPEKWDDYHKAMRRFGEYVMNSFILVNDRVSISAYLKDCIAGKLKGRDAVRKSLYSKVSQYDENSCTHFSYLYARLHIVYAKEIFGEPRWVPFEGRMLPIPTLAEEHLRILFGDDWYNIPPDSGKIVHVAQHDTKRSYLEYMHDYLHYTDTKSIRKHSMHAKILKMFRAKLKNAREKKLANLRARYLQGAFLQHFEMKRVELEEMYQREDYLGLYRFFIPFYEEQLMPIMQNHQIPIDIPERYLELALRAQIAAGYSRKAERIMACYTGKRITSSRIWTEVAELLQQKRDLFIAQETMNPQRVQIADEMFRAYSFDKDVRLMKLWSELSNERLSDSALRILLDEAVIGAEQWADAAEFKKTCADILLRLGEKDRAYELYTEVWRTTNNGMLLLKMNNDPEWVEYANNIPVEDTEEDGAQEVELKESEPSEDEHAEDDLPEGLDDREGKEGNAHD